jgi:hypothetical protein
LRKGEWRKLWENTQDKGRRKTRIREGMELHCGLLNCKTNVCGTSFWDELAASETSVSAYNTTGVVTKKTVIQILTALRTSNLMSRTGRIRRRMEDGEKRRSKERLGGREQ